MDGDKKRESEHDGMECLNNLRAGFSTAINLPLTLMRD